MTAPAPAPGVYGDVEVVVSKRGHWYAVRHKPDGTFDYLAQNIDPAALVTPSEEGCATPGCGLQPHHRGLCGMCLVRDIQQRIR